MHEPTQLTTAVPTHEDCTPEAEAAAVRIAALEALASGNTDDVDDEIRDMLDELDEEADVLDAINEWALDVWATKRVTLTGTTDIVSIGVLFGTGGPHVQALITDDGSTQAEAWTWGRDGYASVNVHAPCLAAVLFDVFATMELS